MTSDATNKSTLAAAEAQGLKKQQGEFHLRSEQRESRLQELHRHAMTLLPHYGTNWNNHSLVTLHIGALCRILHYVNMYEKIIDVPGVICEFGVQWGAGLTQLLNLRNLHEPYNLSRIIYGFDTFEGFAGTHEKDGGFSNTGDYAVGENYQDTLEQILLAHESFAPQAHVKKFHLIKGDASETIDRWIEDNPHALISLAIFDMDLYKPTRDVLEKILPRLTKGSLLVFDELSHPIFPGETLALQEVLGANNIRLQRSPIQPYASWAVFGD